MPLVVSDLIQRAYRVSNIIPIGSVPTDAQLDEGLGYYNSLIRSTIGNEAGDGLTDIQIGGPKDQSQLVADFVPADARLVVTLTTPTTLFLHPYPKDGMRLAVVDSGGNLSTNTLTLDANNYNIEYDNPVLLDIDDQTYEWMFMAHESNWMKIADLELIDFNPFPDDFDDFFILMLATRINPSYGQSITPETEAMLKRSRSQLNARYTRNKPIVSDVDPRLFDANRKYWGYTNTDLADFNRGLGWRL